MVHYFSNLKINHIFLKTKLGLKGKNMTRKALSIIGRIIGLLLVVAIAFFASWCIANPAEAEAEWNKIFNKTPQQEQPNEPDQPTPDKPSEEQINLDGLYYLDVDGDITFVQIKDSKYGTIHGYIQDSKIYLASDWESEIELEPLHITEDEKYLHVFWINQENGQEDKIAIYDKATKKLYYDFSNGEQFPGETYEDQLLFEMIKFENFELHEHSFNEIVYSCPPSCNAAGREIRQCLCGKTEIIETSPALGHNYVNGVCSRCGETAITYQLNYDLGSLMEFVQTDPNGQYTTTEIAINFTSNGKSYSMIRIEYGTGGEPTPYLLFDSDIIYYVPSSNNIVWTDEAYRTITFETAPSGDLLAWLQANATPQA